MENKDICLSKNESNAIKGLLMFLIVLGHNAVFTNTIKGSFNYLYTFHVQTFFILPFLYGVNKCCFKDSFVKNLVRLYYPFVLFFIMLSILWGEIQGTLVDPNSLLDLNLSGWNRVLYFINAILTGNYFLIDYFSGFQYLWFLPVMFSMSVLRETIEDRRLIKSVVLSIGLISYIIFFVFMYKKPYNDDVNFFLMLFSPLAILQGCGAYFLGKTSVKIMSRYNNKPKSIISWLFVIASIIYLILECMGLLSNVVLWCFRFIMPFLFINFLYSLKGRLQKLGVLKNLGIYSFPIYIIHPMLCTIAFMICQKFSCVNIVMAIVVQVIVIFVSYYISVWLFRIEPLRKKIFPRTWEEICHVSRAKDSFTN